MGEHLLEGLTQIRYASQTLEMRNYIRYTQHLAILLKTMTFTPELSVMH
jgi:hypothetical protein